MFSLKCGINLKKKTKKDTSLTGVLLEGENGRWEGENRGWWEKMVNVPYAHFKIKNGRWEGNKKSNK
jgi:hypothetical protein